MDEDALLHTLKHKLQHSIFLDGQKQSIINLLNKNNVLLTLPTGGGKSLVYQFMALHTNKICVVISPLIALINDQIESLRLKRIPAKALSSGVSSKVYANTLEELKEEDCDTKLVYTTPEQVQKAEIQEVLRCLSHNDRLCLIAVDEAHCISEWGHDFRRSYRKLSILKSICPNTPLLACTATATPAVQNDIQKVLEVKNCVHISRSFNRINLSYRVKSIESLNTSVMDDIRGELKQLCEEDCAIIYCFKKSTCEELQSYLRSNGFNAACYHAGLSDKRREATQEKWKNGDIKTLVATIAFGMGIDKPNVRLVIHHSIPKSISGYYQESGRAGRDGSSAVCLLYYSPEDYRELIFITEKQPVDTKNETNVTNGMQLRTAALNALKKVKEYCETQHCRRMYLLGHFGELFEGAPPPVLEDLECCDNCVVVLKPSVQITHSTAFKQMKSNKRFAKSDWLIEDDSGRYEFYERQEYEAENNETKKRSKRMYSTAKQLLVGSASKDEWSGEIEVDASTVLRNKLKRLEEEEEEAEKHKSNSLQNLVEPNKQKRSCQSIINNWLSGRDWRS